MLTYCVELILVSENLHDEASARHDRFLKSNILTSELSCAGLQLNLLCREMKPKKIV